MNVSLVIPAKNEERNLGILLNELRKRYKNNYEIIVVNDASTDRTADIAKQYKATVVTNTKSHGKGFALRTGFAHASGDIIVMMDADLSHKAEDLPLLLAPLNDETIGLVLASRSLGGSEEYTFLRAIGNILITNACNLFLGTAVFDAINGYKAMRKEVTEGLHCNGFEIEIEIIARAKRLGLGIMEVPSQERARAAGTSNLRVVKDGYKFFRQILAESVRNKLS